MLQSPLTVAYIDPVSGAIILQVILAGAVGLVTFFRRSVFGFVRKLFRRGRPSDEQNG